jgi:hypothetical protein
MDQNSFSRILVLRLDGKQCFLSNTLDRCSCTLFSFSFLRYSTLFLKGLNTAMLSSKFLNIQQFISECTYF